VYKWFLLKEKLIFSSLNKLEPKGKYLRGQFWVPNRYQPKLLDSIE